MSKCRYNLTKDCQGKDCIACVLWDIKAEIEQHKQLKSNRSVLINNAYTDCLQIIDKHISEKTESEEV